jgi:hypothetical protein
MQTTETLKPQGRHWRWRTAILFGAPLLLIALVAYVAFFIYWTKHQIAAEFARIDLLDPGWRLEELEARRTKMPDAENSALRALQASALIPRPWPAARLPSSPGEVPLQNLLEVPADRRLSTGQVELLTAELTSAKAAVKEARSLAEMPRGRHDINYQDNVVAILLPHCSAMREVAQLMRYDAMLRAEQGDADGALESCRAMANAGRSIGEEPFFICSLVRMAIRSVVNVSLERTLAQARPTEPALASMQRLLEDDETAPLLLHGARGERALMHHLFEAAKSGKISHGEVKAMLASMGLPDNELIVLFFFGTSARNELAVLRYETEIVEAAKLPPHLQSERMSQIEATSKQQPMIARMFIPAAGRVTEAFHRTLAELRSDIVALSVERYRLAHGVWPASLDDVVPKYLREIPLDPFNGRPLNYRRLGDGVVIYSVGPDHEDNDGHIARDQPKGPHTDIGIRLWDVSQRRQPAPKNKSPEE